MLLLPPLIFFGGGEGELKFWPNFEEKLIKCESREKKTEEEGLENMLYLK